MSRNLVLVMKVKHMEREMTWFHGFKEKQNKRECLKMKILQMKRERGTQIFTVVLFVIG